MSVVTRAKKYAFWFLKASLVGELVLASTEAHAGFRVFRRHSFNHSQPTAPNGSRPVTLSPSPTRVQFIGPTEGLMRPGRWEGSVYQYPDASGNFHTASRALVAPSDGAFKQTVGNELQTVEYSKGDVLFYVEGRGWHKSRWAVGQRAPVPPRAPESTFGGNSFEAEVIRLVNGIRRRAGRSELQPVSRLMSSARSHTSFMASSRRLQHTSANVAENIAMGQSTPAEVVESWMRSDRHRRNILNPNYRVTGVAAVPDAYGRLFWAQQFLF